MPLAIGDKLGPYEILALVGKGGMGEVYRARDTRLNRDIAIKVLPQAFATDAARERFQREARAASALNHPNICVVHDVGEAGGHPFLVMELLQGKTLREHIGESPLSISTILDLSNQITDALDAAHSQRVTHRDIKPANIFVTERGQVKVLDFGLARQNQTLDAEASTQAMLTEPGSAIGTVGYMSPEQARGQIVDERSDLWSFGVVLYEMATGSRPFDGPTTPMIFDSLLNKTPQPVRERNPNVPAELEQIIGKLLEKDRGLRYQHAAEIRADLLRLKRDTDSARAPATPEPLAQAWIATPRVLIATVVALAVSAAAYFVFARVLHGKPKLTDKDTIVLVDFKNKTGDPVFDGTLRQGLAVQLEQSPFLSLVSDDRIQRALTLMGQPADAPLTPEIGRDICQRIGSAAVLEGSISNLGSQYVLGLRAKACRSGEVLDEEQVQTAKKEDVLNALSQIAGTFRSRIGESLSTVEKHNTPLAEATTHSLEALKAYSQGMTVLAAHGDDAAAPFFKRAAEIDPEFAMALARFGLASVTVGETGVGAEYIGKARQLRSRTSDAERFFIDAMYDLQVTGNLERAQQTCQEWAQNYPREPDAHGFLSAMIYVVLGKYHQALEEANKNLAMDPDFALTYLQIAFNEVFLNDLDASDKALREAAARKLETPELATQRYDNAFLRGDRAAMDREVALSAGNPDTEDWASALEAFTQAYFGHLGRARTMSQRAVDLAKQGSRKERAALLEAGPAVREALFGNGPEAARLAKDALSLSNSRDVKYGAALALALSENNMSEAQRRAKELAQTYPEDTVVRLNYLPSLNALFVLKTDPANAVRRLDDAVAYELGTPPSSAIAFFGNLYPVYVRGLAYREAHDWAHAAAEFRKVIEHRNIVMNDPIGAVAHLQLGRALRDSGDIAGAKAAYGDFLTLWKDADPDIPILQQAKAESARL